MSAKSDDFGDGCADVIDVFAVERGHTHAAGVGAIDAEFVAQAVNLSQSAFSRSIQGLEQEFGCVLVDRGNKDLRPTPEGQVVLQHALTLVQGAALLAGKPYATLSALIGGKLTVAVDSASVETLVDTVVERFGTVHVLINNAYLGNLPGPLETKAAVKLEQKDGGFTITRSDLTLTTIPSAPSADLSLTKSVSNASPASGASWPVTTEVRWCTWA